MRRLKPNVSAVVALVGAAAISITAWAVPEYEDALFLRHPRAAATLGGCVACHDGPSPSGLNPFGAAFFANGQLVDDALDALDSDGDGVINGTELEASPATAPGDPGSKPAPVVDPAPPVEPPPTPPVEPPPVPPVEPPPVPPVEPPPTPPVEPPPVPPVEPPPTPPIAPPPPAPPVEPPPSPPVEPPPTPPVEPLPAPPAAADGATLYANNCAGCHKPLVASTKTGATVARTQNAIAGNIGGMGFLSRLTTSDLEAIASALAPPVPPAPPAPTTPTEPPNYTGMWWNPAESGWGLNISHQGDVVFAILFTYDATGAPTWVMMTGRVQADGRSFAGDLLQTTGPAFNAQPFTPITDANVFTVGTMPVTFTSASSATLSYTYAGVTVSKDIVPQVFGTAAASCRSVTGSRAGLTNFQDLWWNPAESGWGVGIVHQNDTLFAVLMTYDYRGDDVWLMTAAKQQPDGSYPGDLYVASGPAFNAQPFAPIGDANLTMVGTMRFVFADGVSGTIDYTVNGNRVTKSISRQVFGASGPACSSPAQYIVPAADGPTLYASHCAACHSALASSAKAGTTVSRIESAIGGNVGGMGYLSSLSSAQLQTIGATLASVAPPPPPPPPTTTDGPTLYADSCAACHGALASSKKAGTTVSRIQSAIAGNVGGMGSLSSLSTAQLQAIASALATVAPPPPPTGTDGPTLYADSCASCHKPLSSSTKGGATLSRIQNAIAGNAGGMGSLASLTNPQLQAIVSALASVTPTPTQTCGSCHALPPKSGEHGEHKSRSCSACHGSGYSSTTVNAATHNNGNKDVIASTGWNPTTRACSNSCHGKESW